MVCDHIFDCPDMEDEQHCDSLSTSGLLYCRFDHIYVHQRYICDGVIHCLLSQDDEALCETFHCPKFCICRGYAVYCDDERVYLTPDDIQTSMTALYIHKGNYKELQGVMFKHNLLVLDIANSQLYDQVKSLPELFVNNKVRLRVLDMSNSSLRHLKGNIFQSLHKLEYFNIQQNMIRYIPANSFIGLSQLMVLNLYNLHIANLNQHAFLGLQSVIVLNLSNNYIKSLNRLLFQPLQKLEIVDIKGNSFQSLELNLFVYASAWITVISTDNIQCCYMKTTTQACIYEHAIVQKGCGSLLTNSLFVTYICGIIFIVFTVITSIFYQMKKAVRNAQVPLIISLSLHDIFSVIVVLYFIAINAIYTHNYPLRLLHISNSVMCKVTGALIVTIQLFPKVIHTLMAAMLYRVTVYALEKTPYSITRMVFYILTGWISVGICSVVWSSFSSHYTWLVCAPFSRTMFVNINNLIIAVILYLTLQLLLLLGAVIINIRMIVYVHKSERRLGIMNSRRLVSVRKRIIAMNGFNVLLYIFEISALVCHLSLGTTHQHTFAMLLFLILILRALINFILHTWQLVNLSRILR